jgi:hypothetical protein
MINRYASLRQGLVGAFCPSLGASGFCLIDRSGYGNHGVLTNMDPGTDWVASGSGLALDFDGVNDRVAIGTSSVLAPNTLATSVWIKPSTLIGTDKAIVSQTDAGGNVGRGVRRQGDAVRWFVASGPYYIWNSGSILTTDWQHLLVVGDGITTPLLWRNGVQRTMTLTLQSGTPTVPAAQSLSIGFEGQVNQTIYNFEGLIDDVRIYNRALTASEIQLLYTGGRGVGLMPERIKHRRKTTAAATNRRRRILIGASQ